MTEEVNHPQHYGGDTEYEVIKVLRAWNLEGAKWFCWGNTIKYLARAEKKGNFKDYEKADWYATELLSIEAELEVRKSDADARMKRIAAGTEPGFTVATPGEPLHHLADAINKDRALPKVNSHWIWKEPNKTGPRCRVVVSSLRSGCIHTTTIAIEGQELPTYSIVKSSFDIEQFEKECTPWDAAAINPWDAEYRNSVNIWPKPGSEWIWEKNKPEMRCRVQVVKINKAAGNEMVVAKVITRDRNTGATTSGEFTINLSRWHEAITPIPDWPYSWEKKV
jgi:Protein of unknwon function (DUF3310)